MKVLRESLRNSPFLGIFCTVTEKIAIFPENCADSSEVMKISEALEVEAIKASIAESSLWGVLAKANSKGIIVPEIMEKREVERLESIGLRVKVIKGNLALGNLVAANDSKAVISPAIPKKQREEIEKFLKVDAMEARIAGTDLAGSSLLLTNKAFLASNNAKKEEVEKLEKFLGVKGKATTANCGDSYIGNSAIANSSAVIAGSQTTNIELLKIQEAFSE